MNNEFLKKAFAWVAHPTGEGILSLDEYCPTRDIFLARIQRIDASPLFIAVLGEIGNNAYDHNLGNWRNVPGIYFVREAQNTAAIIADRGQGVRTTLSRVEPNLRSDRDALEVAFTKSVSGRAPERRGNGLKFVRNVIQTQKWNLQFYSGTGKAIIKEGSGIEFSEEDRNIEGCIGLIST